VGEGAMGRWGDGEKSPNPQSDEFLRFSVISPTPHPLLPHLPII
jgi:hypothetical protein